ncbi:MAG TPA: hypothetical protein VN969_29515 [Streptosporangiaceae bacterium]|nr:hypothetical protein [Streptosporangiaceae bacterium]
MLGSERARHFDLYGLGSAERGIEPRMLACQRFIALVDLVRDEDGLRLPV